MAKRGIEAQRVWESITATPLYEAVTVWVMAAWPDQMLDRVDTMVRTAIAAGYRVHDGEWTIARLIGVVRKAGRRPEHQAVHRHLGQQVRVVSYDAAALELADEASESRAGLLFTG